MINIQNEYRDLLSDILATGTPKKDRTNTGTQSIFARMLRHDMSCGFPLLTAKKIYFNHAITELLWILQGRTDMQYLQHHGVTYWDDNYTKSKRTDNTLGPVYGKQLRNFNGIDQLKYLLKQIKKEPSSRRIMAGLWNPAELDDMALPPCHYGFQIYINNNKLSLAWSQRSVDVFLGLPYDLAMYGLLLLMLAKGSGYEPGELSCFLGDCHLYSNHLKQSVKYLNRPDNKLPTVELKKGLYLTDKVNIPVHSDIILKDYNCLTPIKAPLAT